MSPARSKLIDYEKLPDIMSTAELNKLFKEVLELYQQRLEERHEFLEEDMKRPDRRMPVGSLS